MMSDKLRAAAQAALDCLDILSKLGNGDVDGNSKGNEIAQDARQNLRAALAEPTVQESLTVAVQERMHPEIKKMYEDYFDKCFRESSAPPRREWVGLTDDEIEHLRNDQPWWMVRDIEAKLREKNGG